MYETSKIHLIAHRRSLHLAPELFAWTNPSKRRCQSEIVWFCVQRRSNVSHVWKAVHQLQLMPPGNAAYKHVDRSGLRTMQAKPETIGRSKDHWLLSWLDTVRIAVSIWAWSQRLCYNEVARTTWYAQNELYQTPPVYHRRACRHRNLQTNCRLSWWLLNLDSSYGNNIRKVHPRRSWT